MARAALEALEALEELEALEFLEKLAPPKNRAPLCGASIKGSATPSEKGS